MVDYKELNKIINASGAGVKHYKNGVTSVRDSFNFRGMSMSKVEEAQELLIEAHKEDTNALAKKCGISKVDTLATVTTRATRNIDTMIDCFGSTKQMNAREIKNKAMSATSIRDSITNPSWNINTSSDPTRNNLAFPNIYLSPWEANSLYSQKGIFETIINKKSKSILLNGIDMKNPRLSQEQLDIVRENMLRKNFKNVVSESTLISLVYGGSLVFPMFKKDSPLTTAMNLNQLLKLGVLGKDCIDYFVKLDRWNNFIIPPYNPTQKDFLRPDVYMVPFLGSDVYHGRCARVITAPQAGYWGQVINQGWGISDLCGYLQSGTNYKVAVQSLPLMIQQMSILARTVNIDGVLATEGANALDSLIDGNTIRTRQASLDNPVTMDVLGELKSIDRNFSQVPELLRILRQDLASDATMPEPLLFSSEKGNFSSGDDTQGNLAKQYEVTKMMHKELEPQFKPLAKIMIIDALGATKEVIEALPYTSLSFDEPVIANAVERATIGKLFSENVFNLVSANIPIDVAVKMASANVSNDMAISADISKQLRAIQTKSDANDDIRAKQEEEQKKAELELTKQTTENAKKQGEMIGKEPTNGAKGTTGATGTTGVDKPISKKQKPSDKQSKTRGKSPAEEQREKAIADKEEKENGYSRLEQKRHENARLGSSKRNEKLAKSAGKAIKKA